MTKRKSGRLHNRLNDAQYWIASELGVSLEYQAIFHVSNHMPGEPEPSIMHGFHLRAKYPGLTPEVVAGLDWYFDLQDMDALSDAEMAQVVNEKVRDLAQAALKKYINNKEGRKS